MLFLLYERVIIMDRIKEFSTALFLKLKKTYDQGVNENFLVLLLVVIGMLSIMTLLGQQMIDLFSRITDVLTF